MSNIQTGINISRSRIEVVQINKVLGRYQLLKYGTADIEKENPYEYGVSAEQDRFTDLQRPRIVGALRKVFEENNIEPIQVIAAIPDDKIILRYFSMPLLPQKEWEGAVRFEAQKYIPFRMEEVVADFFIIDTKDRKKELKVVFVATKKDVLANYSEIFKDASVAVVAFETPSLALMRIFRSLNLLSKKDITAILYVEKAEAVLSICDNTILYLMRDFSLSSPLRTGSANEAEFSQRGSDNSEYENLLREIQLSFDYHYKHLPALKIENLIVLGRDNLERWKEYLEKDLKISVLIANPNAIFKGDALLDSTMSTAVGLALRGFHPQLKKINLLAKAQVPEFKEPLKDEKTLLMRAGVLELILGLFVMFLVHVTMVRQTKIINSNLSEVKKVREKLGAEFSKAGKEELLKMQRELNREKTVLGRLVDKRIYLTPQLSELPRLLPAGVWLEDLRIETKTDENSGAKSIKLIIEGKVFASNQRKSEPELINELISNIKNSPLLMTEFRKVELGFMEKSEEKGFPVTRFKVICSG